MKYIIKTLSLFIIMISFTHSLPMQAQNPVIWRDISERSLPDNEEERPTMPQKYRLVEANMAALDDLLGQAPLEHSREARDKVIELMLPLPDGTLGLFRVENSPIMEAPLAAKYPHMTTYQAWGISDKTASARLDRVSDGFHAMILSASDTVFIRPYQANDTTHYISYYRRDEAKITFKETLLNNRLKPLIESRQQVKIGDVLHTYRLAVATTGEYTEMFGGVDGAMASVVSTVNRVVGLMQRDISTRLVLIGDNNKIIFTDKTTDPFSDLGAANHGDENQKALDDLIGTANYDMGHVFDTGGAGEAAAGPCLAEWKAKGQSGYSNKEVPMESFAVNMVAHEMGHQFAASHTFNAKSVDADGCSPTNFMAEGAYEPGGGSTIMSYAGSCENQNLQNDSDDYYHAITIQEMTAYINGPDGKSCGTHTPTGNNLPVVNVEGDKTIGFNTPFTLKGSATDADGDTLIYAWEQFDKGEGWTEAAILPNTDIGVGPIFRSYKPVAASNRTFPNPDPAMKALADKGESLPNSARVLHFRLTVRDGQGGVSHADMKVNVTADGPQATPTTPNNTPTATATLDPNVTPTATVEPGSIKVFLPIIIKGSNPTEPTPTTQPTEPTPTTQPSGNRVNNGNFDNGKNGWNDEGSTMAVPGGCAVGQADISGNVFQCIVINRHATQWSFGATIAVQAVGAEDNAGIAVDFYNNATCDSSQQAIFTQNLNTSNSNATPLSQTFDFDSQAQNAGSVSVNLYTQAASTGGTPPHACFDEAFLR